MRTRFLLLLLLSTAAIPLQAQTDADRLDSLMSRYTRLDRFSGAVLIARHDTVLLHKGYGMRHINPDVPNDTATLFQLASITKTFTATLILQLAEHQKLALTDKISRYFPGFPRGDSITISHLLTHTSGIFDYTRDPDNSPSKAGMPRYLAGTTPDFAVGSSWRYSNSNYYLLGLIIEQVTGLTYEAAVRRYLFEPLEMPQSGLDFKRLASPLKATGYYADTSSERPKKIAPLYDSTGPFAAGAIFSGTTGLYQWHKGLQQYRVLGRAMQEKAYTPNKYSNYGYGWQIDSAGGRRVVSHSGAIPGFRTNFARMPEDNICIVLLCNMESENLNTITEKILAVLQHRPYTLPAFKHPLRLPPATLRRFTGDYNIPGRFTLHVTLEGERLFAQPSGQPRSELFAERENHFFIKEADIELEFAGDTVKINNGERRMEGKRIR